MESWNNKWQINQGTIDMLGNAGTPAKFELLEDDAEGTAFVVKFEPGELNEGWKDCRLVARGSESWLWQGEKLQPFDGSGPKVNEYRTAIDANFAKTGSATNRLEGKVTPGGATKLVSLYLAHDAVQVTPSESADLLFVRYTKLPAEGEPGVVGPIEEGTGHGNKTSKT